MINISMSKTEPYRRVPVVLFIGAIHLNPLIRPNLAALRIGELINQKSPIIKCNFLIT